MTVKELKENLNKMSDDIEVILEIPINDVELKPMDVGVAFMRKYEEGFNTIYRIEAMIPYSNIAYIFCDPDEEDS